MQEGKAIPKRPGYVWHRIGGTDKHPSLIAVPKAKHEASLKRRGMLGVNDLRFRRPSLFSRGLKIAKRIAG